MTDMKNNFTHILPLLIGLNYLSFFPVFDLLALSIEDLRSNVRAFQLHSLWTAWFMTVHFHNLMKFSSSWKNCSFLYQISFSTNLSMKRYLSIFYHCSLESNWAQIFTFFSVRFSFSSQKDFFICCLTVVPYFSQIGFLYFVEFDLVRIMLDYLHFLVKL